MRTEADWPPAPHGHTTGTHRSLGPKRGESVWYQAGTRDDHATHRMSSKKETAKEEFLPGKGWWPFRSLRGTCTCSRRLCLH